MIFLAATPQQSAAGFTQLYPSFSSVSARGLWILNDLFVSADCRRAGVARTLMEAARQHVIATGAVRLVLSTAHTNAGAQRLYESLGYVRDEEFIHCEFEV